MKSERRVSYTTNRTRWKVTLLGKRWSGHTEPLCFVEKKKSRRATAMQYSWYPQGGIKKKYANETNLVARYIKWILNAGVNQTEARLWFLFQYYFFTFRWKKFFECKISAKFEYVLNALIQLQCTQEILQFGRGRLPAWAAAVLRVNVGWLTGPWLSHQVASCRGHRVTSIVPYSEM